MRLKALPILTISTLVLSLLSACGTRGVRVTEGSEQIGAAPKGSLYLTDTATIVHVDEFERLATLRNARKFPAGSFLETRDSKGEPTAILKTRPNRETGLGIADILEGQPKINDHALPVSASESDRLSKIYRAPSEQ